MLGYQNKPNHTQSRSKNSQNSSRQEDKNASIKNFVVLMRKKR